MKKQIKIILSIAGLVLLTSCFPDRFWLNQNQDFPLICLKLNDIDSVKKIHSNEIMIYGGGVAALKSDDLTQLAADFTTKILYGSGVTFLFRTVSDKYENKPAIRFDFTESGSTVFENDSQLVYVDSVRVKPGKDSRIIIRNDAQTFTITVDCDTVIKSRTFLPATEYVILKSYKGSKVNVSGISFSEEYEWTQLKFR